MAFTLLKPDGIDLSQTFAFTGSVTGVSGGKVLQVVTATVENSTESTTSTSFVASSLQLNITPSATSSKILVMMNGGQIYTGGASKSLNFTLYKDSTNLGHSTRGMGRFSVSNEELSAPHSAHYLDSPSSSSQLNYRAYYNSDDGSQVYFGTGSMGKMSLTALEIGA